MSVIDFRNIAPATEIVDSYPVPAVAVPPVDSPGEGAGGAEITLVQVTLRVIKEDDPDDDIFAGDVMADVGLRGYRLTKAGKRDARTGSVTIYGLREEETRYEIARAAVQASLGHHGLDGYRHKVIDHPMETWAEYSAQRLAALGFALNAGKGD